MLENIKVIINKYKLNLKGIIHIGAGTGSELRQYKNLIDCNFLLIEADPQRYKKLFLRKLYYSIIYNKNISIANYVITDVSDKEISFNIMSERDCNSIFDFYLHKKIYKNINQIKKIKLNSKTLNSIFEKKFDINNYNFINIDIQGAELLAFKGANNILNQIDAIYTEVNFKELYKGCALVHEIDDYLSNFGFKRVFTKTPMHETWGDALYLK